MRMRVAMTAAVLALGSAWPPPASAVGATTVVVTGTLTLSGPMAAPCTAGPCPPAVIPTPPPFISKMGPLFSVEGGALRTGSFTQATCAPAPCSVVLSTSARGYCGLATGRGSAGIAVAGDAHLLELTWTWVGAELVVRGNARRQSTGEVGDVFATLAVVSTGTQCTTMPVAGDLTVTYPKATP